jgi:hypothetical protein
MAGIGMAIAVTPDYEANIEDTLVAASVEGMEHDRLRELSVLTTWWQVHATWVNADRLITLVSRLDSARAHAYWAALAQMKHTDPRFRRLGSVARAGERMPLLHIGSKFQVQRKGEDPRFRNSPLIVPEGTLRRRAMDVLPSERVAHHHAAYRARIMLGPSYRADMWALLDREPSISGSELARRTYGSVGTASRVKRDHALWRAAA